MGRHHRAGEFCFFGRFGLELYRRIEILLRFLIVPLLLVDGASTDQSGRKVWILFEDRIEIAEGLVHFAQLDVQLRSREQGREQIRARLDDQIEVPFGSFEVIAAHRQTRAIQ